jgi:hypothetical protein
LDTKVRWPLYLVVVATALGAWLRFAHLGDPCFWIDETIFISFVRDGIPRQEYVPVLLAKIIGTPNEFWTRFPFALAGAFTIPAVYLVSRDERLGGCAALFVATFPLFVFWSRMARPYAFAVLFIVLGWRYPWAYFLAVLTTPAALIGLDLGKVKHYWKLYTTLFVLALFTYTLRGDVQAGSNFIDWKFLTSVRRVDVIPGIMLLLYLCRYCQPHVHGSGKGERRHLRAGGLVR